MSCLRFCLLGMLMGSWSFADVAIEKRYVTQPPAPDFLLSGVAEAYDAYQEVTIALEHAEVDIDLSVVPEETDRGYMAYAKVEATFRLRDLREVGNDEGTEFLVAFPVSEISQRIGPADNFSVLVDGVEPPLAWRREGSSYYRGRYYYPVDDRLNDKEWPERFTARETIDLHGLDREIVEVKMVKRLEDGTEIEVDPPKPEPAGTIPSERYQDLQLADKSSWGSAYIWPQTIKAGASQKVVVKYGIRLWPKDHTARVEEGSERISDSQSRQIKGVIGNREFYLFDYVLKSGATWDGNIGYEIVRLHINRSLEKEKLVALGREGRLEGDTWIFELKDEDPTENILIAIPAP